MKKMLLFFAVLFPAAVLVYAQLQEDALPRMDAAVRTLAADMHKKLSQDGNGKTAVGQFTYRNSPSSFGSYLSNQLGVELANISGRPYTVLSGGIAGADRMVSGEIVDVGRSVRVYVRIIRSADRSVIGAFSLDFERNQYLVEMLSGGGDGSRPAALAADAWEFDSPDYPLLVELAAGENAPVINRTFHNETDEDFFLLLPDSPGRIALETTGSTDTIMELIDADTGEEIAENDDGGSNHNAMIRWNVQAGKRYIAKVHGYDGKTGRYGFRAYFSAQAAVVPDEYENDDDPSSAKPLAAGTPQRHTFHNGDDVDWIQFQIDTPGRYTIWARGTESTRLDTYIELFDENENPIAENDDGGDHYDARLSRRLERGLYYLSVKCLDDEPEEPYTVSVQPE